MKTINFQLETLTCAGCVHKIEGTLSRSPGVREATVLFKSSKVKVTFDEQEVGPAEIITIFFKLGYHIKSAEVAA